MNHYFFKYQGTGNDFIVFDDRQKSFAAHDAELVQRLCDRRFGIGSDGILLLQDSLEADFHVDFINPDGSRSFCGNGSRCAVAFASLLGLFSASCTFSAIDGLHRATLAVDGLVSLGMSDVEGIEHIGQDFLLDTGSPHYIRIVEDLESVDVASAGRELRYGPRFAESGVNVNFVERIDDSNIRMRTYERGVEDETLSCGTGVTAAVLALRAQGSLHSAAVNIQVPGGRLVIEAEQRTPSHFVGVKLIGPATKVFSGEISL